VVIYTHRGQTPDIDEEATIWQRFGEDTNNTLSNMKATREFAEATTIQQEMQAQSIAQNLLSARSEKCSQKKILAILGFMIVGQMLTKKQTLSLAFIVSNKGG
jgi:hypothetical protein